MKRKSSLLIIIAITISRVFGFGTFVLLAIVAIFSGRFLNSDYPWILLTAVLFLFTGGLLFICTKLKIFSDFDLSRRGERPLFFFLLILLGVGLLFLYIVFGASLFLRYFIIIYLVEIILDFLITLFWKISNHTLSVTSFVLFSIILLGYSHLYLILLIPFVAWARLYLKKHTLGQIVGGILLATFVIIPLSRIFGFI